MSWLPAWPALVVVVCLAALTADYRFFARSGSSLREWSGLPFAPGFHWAAEGQLETEGSADASSRHAATPHVTTVAVWTAMTNGYDKGPYDCRQAYNSSLQLNVTCFYLTDNTDEAFAGDLRARGWLKIYIPNPPGMRMNVAQRRMKILVPPEANFETYDFSVYHDANLKPTEYLPNIAVFFAKFHESPDLRIIAYAHGTRTTAEQEREIVRKGHICDAKEVHKSAELVSGYPDQGDLIEGNILFRRGIIDETLRRGQQRWFDTMTQSGCIRDQLAFGFAMWKENVTYLALPMDRGKRIYCCLSGHRKRRHHN